MPEFDYFDPESRNEDEYKALKEWYDECVKSDREFDFQKELKEYCQEDVRILAAGVVKFSNLIEEKTNGIQCFIKSSTIASLAILVFRSMYLSEATIPSYHPWALIIDTGKARKHYNGWNIWPIKTT